jgi:hypothetical protein
MLRLLENQAGGMLPTNSPVDLGQIRPHRKPEFHQAWTLVHESADPGSSSAVRCIVDTALPKFFPAIGRRSQSFDGLAFAVRCPEFA